MMSMEGPQRCSCWEIDCILVHTAQLIALSLFPMNLLMVQGIGKKQNGVGITPDSQMNGNDHSVGIPNPGVSLANCISRKSRNLAITLHEGLSHRTAIWAALPGIVRARYST